MGCEDGRVAIIGLYDIGTSTTLESNKSHAKITVSQADDALQTSLLGQPVTIDIGRMGAIERTTSCQPSGAYLSGLALEWLGSRSTLQGRLGQAHAGQ